MIPHTLVLSRKERGGLFGLLMDEALAFVHTKNYNPFAGDALAAIAPLFMVEDPAKEDFSISLKIAAQVHRAALIAQLAFGDPIDFDEDVHRVLSVLESVKKENEIKNYLENIFDDLADLIEKSYPDSEEYWRVVAAKELIEEFYEEP